MHKREAKDLEEYDAFKWKPKQTKYWIVAKIIKWQENHCEQLKGKVLIIFADCRQLVLSETHQVIVH